jgi:hypothetical protein
VIRPVAQHNTTVICVIHLWKKDLVLKTPRLARIVSRIPARLAALVTGHFRGDDHRSSGIQDRYLIRDSREMTVLE